MYPSTKKLSLCGSMLVCAVILQQTLEAQTHPEVLVVYNTTSSDSLAVANHYMAARNIPPANLCAIAPPVNDYLYLSDYNTYVKTPIQNCLNAIGPRSILYIVMSYLTPFVVYAGPMGSSAVDSYLADIWDKYVSQPFIITPSGPQPYYADSQSQGNVYVPFQTLAAFRANTRNPLIYSVWRLDAPSAAIASALVDQAIYTETHGGLTGQACIDRRYGDLTGQADLGYTSADFDLHQAATFYGQALAPSMVTEDSNLAEFGGGEPDCPDTAFYSGWYSLDNYYNAFVWQPGAVGWHIDSESALNPRGGSSWVPNALAAGITATTGSVNEPYLAGFVRPGGTMRNLLEGARVGDAFLRNTRWLKWEIMNVGDPLYTPFPGGRAPFSPLQPVNSFQLTQQELVGGANATGIITLNSPAPLGGATFNLSATPGASVPATVMVSGGSTRATFPITTTVVTQTQPALISASSGFLSLQNTLTLDPLLGIFVPSALTTMAGLPVTVNVVLNGRAPSGGATISLASDNPAVTVPASVTVPAGAMFATFTANSTPVSSAVVANITGTYAGAITGTYWAGSQYGLAVVPAISSFNPYPGTISAGAPVDLRLILGANLPAGTNAVVNLMSSDPGSLPVPPQVTVSAGGYYLDIFATSSPSASGKTVTVTAQYGGSTGTATVTIN